MFHQESKTERQKSLFNQFNFKCDCEACLNDFPMAANLPKMNKEIPNESENDTLLSFYKNCIFIDENYDPDIFPCYEVCKAMSKILQYCS